MIKLTPIGIDGWNRVVFKGDNGRFYKTTELVPNEGFMSLDKERQLKLLRSLCTTDEFDGEPDFPCWKEGTFSIEIKRPETIKAIDVFNAARNTFSQYGNEQYASSKADNFLKRCGVKPENELEHDVSKRIVERVVYAMLDDDSERVFWENLNK